MDLGAQLRDLDLAREQRNERSKPCDGIGFLQQRDAIVEVEIGTGAGDVRDQLGISRTRHRDRGVRADLGAGVDVVRKQCSHRTEERVDLGTLGDIQRRRV